MFSLQTAKLWKNCPRCHDGYLREFPLTSNFDLGRSFICIKCGYIIFPNDLLELGAIDGIDYGLNHADED